MRLLDEIVVFVLDVYKLRILSVGDCSTDLLQNESCRFGRISAYRWLSQMANKLQF